MMKIEKLKPPTFNRCATAADMLRALKPGHALRVKTAQQWRNVAGAMNSVGKSVGVKFRSRNDGDTDVIVFIQEKP